MFLEAGRKKSFFSLSVRTYPFVFPRVPPNLKLAFKRQTVNVVWIVNPLFNGRELEMLLNEVYLLKLFKRGSERDLEQSTVYVIYLIQELKVSTMF